MTDRFNCPTSPVTVPLTKFDTSPRVQVLFEVKACSVVVEVVVQVIELVELPPESLSVIATLVPPITEHIICVAVYG